MNIKRWLCPAVVLFLAGVSGFSAEPAWRPFAFSVDASTLGPGVSATWRFADHFGARAGFHYFSYSHNDTIEGIEYDATVRPMSEVLTLNYYPWKKRSFYISVGALFNQNELKGDSQDNGFTLGSTTFPAGQVGTLHLRVEQQPVNPYVSIGGTFFRFGRTERWALNGELGVAYAGEPRVSLTRTGGLSSGIIDAAVEDEEEQIRDALKDYRFLPVVKLSLSYSW